MPIKVGTQPILTLKENQYAIEKAYVGYNLVYGVGDNKPDAPGLIPNLVAWYDASDYTTGSYWYDRSGNNLTLELKTPPAYPTAISKITVPIEAVWFSKSEANAGGGWGYSTGWGSFFTSSDLTYIEIYQPYPNLLNTNDSTFGIGFDHPVGSERLCSTGSIGVSVNEPFVGDNGYALGTGCGVETYQYKYGETVFIARRVSSGFNNTSGLNISYANDNGTSLVHLGPGNFYEQSTGTTSYSMVGGSDDFVLGSRKDGPTYDAPGYYAVSITYDRILSDAEIQTIYDYYKTTYSLS